MIDRIKAYRPYNEQEQVDKAVIIRLLEGQQELFCRGNLTAHMTASAWITNAARDRVLMAYHNIYDSWSWLGGHADGEPDLLKVALAEVREESGLLDIRPVSEDIFSLEVLTVDGHEKGGHYVPSHLHLNVTYLIEANERDHLMVKADENSSVAWFGLEEAAEASTEPWFRERIYAKLNARLRELLESEENHD